MKFEHMSELSVYVHMSVLCSYLFVFVSLFLCVYVCLCVYMCMDTHNTYVYACLHTFLSVCMCT